MANTKTNISTLDVFEILDASKRISEVVMKTPFQKNLGLSQKYGCQIFLKREDLQVVRSFKIRGAYNKMAKLSKEEMKQGVICASAGNHAQGVAFACKHLKVKGKIFMPDPTPRQKIKKVRQFGEEWVEIILEGDTYDDAQLAARKEAEKSGCIFIHPFEDVDVIAGQGTIAPELLDQSTVPLDYLLVAVGGGGLLAGVASYFKVLSPKTKIIAIESEGAASLSQSMEAGQVVELDKIDTFADGIAVKKVGELNFNIVKGLIDQTIQVPEGKISTAILELYNEEAIVVEPAGAVGVAALDFVKNVIKGKNVGIIICGGNNDINRTQEIKERSMLYEGLKHYFIIRFPQRAGALRDFLHLLGPNDDITHFQYTKKNNRESGPALVGIEIKEQKDFDVLLQRMQKECINFRHLNSDPTLFETMV